MSNFRKTLCLRRKRPLTRVPFRGGSFHGLPHYRLDSWGPSGRFDAAPAPRGGRRPPPLDRELVAQPRPHQLGVCLLSSEMEWQLPSPNSLCGEEDVSFLIDTLGHLLKVAISISAPERPPFDNTESFISSPKGLSVQGRLASYSGGRTGLLLPRAKEWSGGFTQGGGASGMPAETQARCVHAGDETRRPYRFQKALGVGGRTERKGLEWTAF